MQLPRSLWQKKMPAPAIVIDNDIARSFNVWTLFILIFMCYDFYGVIYLAAHHSAIMGAMPTTAGIGSRMPVSEWKDCVGMIKIQQKITLY